jgi:signal transduction histidine kinase
LPAILRTRLSTVVVVSVIYVVVLAASLLTLLTPPRLSLALSVTPPHEARIEWLMPGGALWERGVRPGDSVITLDGTSPSPQDAGEWSGGRVEARTSTGAPVQTSASLMREGHDTWPLLLLSPWFFLLGTLIFLRAAESAVARTAYALFATAALALALAAGARDELPPFVFAEWIVVIAFVGSFVQFFLHFPTARGSSRLRALLWLPPIAVALLAPASVIPSSLYELAAQLRLVVLSLYILGGVGIAIWSATRSGDWQGRRGLAIVGSGTLASMAPFLGLHLLPSVLNGSPLVSSEQSILALALMPASFAYAILRHHVLEVRLLQRWLVQGLLWLALLAPCAALVYLLKRLLATFPASAPMLAIEAALVLLVGVSVAQLRAPLRRLLDRLVFRDSYDYRASLQRLSRDLSLAGDLDSLGASLPARLCRLMNLDFALLVVDAPGGPRVLGEAGSYAPEMLPNLIAASASATGEPEVLPLAYGYLHVLVAPLRTHGERVGRLCLGPKRSGEPFRREDRDLLGTLSGQLAAVVRNAQLVDDLRAKVADLDALNERLERAREEERAHLAAEIHDEPLQTAMHLQRQLEGAAGEGQVPPQAHATLGQALVRQLRTICTTVRPPVLDDLGLHAALDALAQEQSARGGVSITVEVGTEGLDAALSPSDELVLYRAAQEAINNALRHARATSVCVSLRRRGDTVQLTVEDDGAGFPAPASLDSLAASGHLGLAGMRRRVQRAGGRFSVSSAAGRGTAVLVELPIREVTP